MKIAVVMQVTEEQKEWFRKAAPDAHFTYGEDPADLKEAEVIIGNISPREIKHLPKLKWLQLETAGARSYCLPGLVPESVLLTNATGAYGLNIAEHILGMVLGLMKNFPRYEENRKAHLWKDEGAVRTLFGSTVLIVGFGDLGRCFGRLAKALGAHVIGIRRRSTALQPEADEMETMDHLNDCLARADVVVSCLPDTKDTEGLYSAQRFAAMKKGVLFVNVGRGSAVIQEALIDALRSGQVGGAALDVTNPEPLPVDDPLWDAPNLMITPHVSGGFHAKTTWDRVAAIAADNLTRYCAGQPLKNLVDRETGYRK
jgi:phosphoglycerate dehydrogenase-like enzyme